MMMMMSLNAGIVITTLGYLRMASAVLSVMERLGPSYESGTHPYTCRDTFWRTSTRFFVECCDCEMWGDHWVAVSKDIICFMDWSRDSSTGDLGRVGVMF